jgi:hypothetical protein
MPVYQFVIAKAGSKIKELGPNPGDNVFVKRQGGHLSVAALETTLSLTDRFLIRP